MLLIIWHYFLELLWLFLPAGCANMLAGLSKHIRFLDYPVDFAKTWRGKRIFGDHKTWRGFFFGLLASLIMVYVQRELADQTTNYNLINYQEINIYLFGLLAGLGALLGDLLRSFFKRRKDVAPGKIWFPWDQVDWIIGAIIFISFYIPLSADRILTAIAVALIMHPLVNYICYLLKLQKNKF